MDHTIKNLNWTYFIVLSAFLLFNCNAQKKPQSNTSNNENTKNANDWKVKGYILAKVIKSANQNCNILLITETDEYLDPINWDIYSSNFSDYPKVWIKYDRLRRISRCENTTPINLTSIERETH